MLHAELSQHSVLAVLSDCCPHLCGRLSTRYSPVCHSTFKSKLSIVSFDLHVLSTPPAFVLSQDQTLHEIWKAEMALLSFWILICAKHKSSKEIADCYMFIVIDVRCFRIQTSGFTSWLHDVLHCLVFKEHPRFPPARCAFRESASIYYLIRFGLSRTF